MCDGALLNRLARYLKDKQRIVSNFAHQWQPTRVDVFIDADFAGCSETRKSTNVGAMMHGGHLLKTWISNQSVVALFQKRQSITMQSRAPQWDSERDPCAETWVCRESCAYTRIPQRREE